MILRTTLRVYQLTGSAEAPDESGPLAVGYG